MKSCESERFKKLLFRASKAQAYVTFFEIKEPMYDYTGEKLDLKLYFVVYPHRMKTLKERLEKVCESFNGDRFEIPSESRALRTA